MSAKANRIRFMVPPLATLFLSGSLRHPSSSTGSIAYHMAAQLPDRRLEAARKPFVDHSHFNQQPFADHPERARDLRSVDAAYEGFLEWLRDLLGQEVHAASFPHRSAEAETCERQDVIPHRADHVFRLPGSPAGDG